jgi:hypothetical protein
MWLASIGSPGRGRARVIQSGSRRLRVLALLAAAGLVAAGCGSSQHSTGGAAAASFNAKIGSLY